MVVDSATIPREEQGTEGRYAGRPQDIQETGCKQDGPELKDEGKDVSLARKGANLSGVNSHPGGLNIKGWLVDFGGEAVPQQRERSRGYAWRSFVKRLEGSSLRTGARRGSRS